MGVYTISLPPFLSTHIWKIANRQFSVFIFIGNNTGDRSEMVWQIHTAHHKQFTFLIYKIIMHIITCGAIHIRLQLPSLKPPITDLTLSLKVNTTSPLVLIAFHIFSPLKRTAVSLSWKGKAASNINGTITFSLDIYKSPLAALLHIALITEWRNCLKCFWNIIPFLLMKKALPLRKTAAISWENARQHHIYRYYKHLFYLQTYLPLCFTLPSPSVNV